MVRLFLLLINIYQLHIFMVVKLQKALSMKLFVILLQNVVIYTLHVVNHIEKE